MGSRTDTVHKQTKKKNKERIISMLLSIYFIIFINTNMFMCNYSYIYIYIYIYKTACMAQWLNRHTQAVGLRFDPRPDH